MPLARRPEKGIHVLQNVGDMCAQHGRDLEGENPPAS